MEPAPVPPHERSWRHPSELAPTRGDLDPDFSAPARSPLPLLAGTLAVAVVVVLVVAITPQAGDDSDVAAVTTLPAFSTEPPSGPTRTVATGVSAGLSAASVGFARLTAIPSAIAVTPSIADAPAVPVDDGTFVYLLADDAIYRTRWHVLRVHADPSWLLPLGATVVVTGAGHHVADIVDGEVVVTAD